ncbi:hypothetical protein Metal_3806 [Methylomicrobium album BG8]|uniref:Uncharacterized protein n=1 Tax=Methylomicrobium album BG8 TaxID=686340 RepID=H8GID6_METAL|nr:hypothetical protein Metal_3806 [Methylomicrobium album BG8]
MSRCAETLTEAVKNPYPCSEKKPQKKAYLYDDTKNGVNIKGILLIEDGGVRARQAITADRETRVLNDASSQSRFVCTRPLGRTQRADRPIFCPVEVLWIFIHADNEFVYI